MPFSLPRPDAESSRPELAALIGRIAQADEVALAEFYQSTCRRVFGLIAGIVGESHVAEEVTLDVYAQVWQQAVTFSMARGSALAWLLTIARSRAIDRARKLRGGHDRTSVERLAAELFAADPTPVDAAVLGERGARVRAAVAELPRGQREAIAAAYFQGLTHTEIAATLEVPLGTIKTRIRAGLSTLASALSGLEPELR